ncbi:uncharacterized protein LOC114265286 [Camellia sinensis]|uniref:uncharacterized protein LOC114265286 n=1 Tax=Camellia sinensis TaxID=4442 RepID=UPI001035C456|nr:uncharacterized protein LOC114265286 [Camellia sinensis]
MANAHRRVNQIGRIRVNGVEFSSSDEVKASIVGFYEHLFRCVGKEWRPGLDGVSFDVISDEECTSLERPFTEEEVLKALQSMPGDKAPGPDAVLVANECVDSRLHQGNEGIICKLDIEKAYDNVDWDFLMYLLEMMQFGAKWRRWILFCISTMRMSVLVNGSPAGFLPTHRGLRQGDHLSPLLFILVMEALGRLLARAVQAGLLNGFEVGVAPGNVTVSHLFYADDALIFCDAKEAQIGHLRCVLLCFEAVSGLRINLAKSELISVGQVTRSSVLAAILRCKVVSLPVTYLGLPLGASFKATGIWEGVVDWVRRLAGWQRQYLSKGGRLTLIKSILSSILTYFMSIHVIPVSVARRIEKLQRDFLWGEGGRYHLVSWDRICRSKEQGRLGVRRLVLFNLALLGKWLWRFVEKREQLWRRVVVAKFGVVRGAWCSGRVGHSHGFGWCGDLSLELRFPLIFAIATNFEVLADNDALVWDCPRAKGIFTVSSFYGALVEDKCVVDGTFIYPWKSVWVSGMPSKVAFFVWTVSLGRILTIDNLIRRGHILVNWCCLCGQAAESVDHLLIHCSVSSCLWMLVVAMFGLVWVQLGSLFAVLQSWVGRRVGKRRQKAWILALHCLLWLIW